MKIFMDAVHGQIHVPKDYCSLIIDTVLFQRLKRVEQTFVSSIFPTATHNRFSHSLGVYHIGKQLINAIENNKLSRINEIKKELNKKKNCFLSNKNDDSVKKSNYDILKESFQLACLLHDCGHAPFSHTFEKHYLRGGLKNNRVTQNASYDDIITALKEDSDNIFRAVIFAADEMRDRFQNAQIIEDFVFDLCTHVSENRSSIKAHEYVSAWLILNKHGFRDNIVSKPLHGDPLLMARMVMGVPYRKKLSESEKILNCYIGLLNGNIIDADRIDYAARDQWAMGISISSLNLSRLLTSIHIGRIEQENEYVIAYTKKAIKELQVLIENKNYCTYWLFNHHKFKFLESSLERSVTCLAILLSNHEKEYNKLLSKNTEDENIKRNISKIETKANAFLFNYNYLVNQLECSFKFNNKNICEKIIHPCDDDIIFLLKKYFDEDDKNNKLIHLGHVAFYEWFSRERTYIPIWKSQAEYVGVFQDRVIKHIKTLKLDEKERETLRSYFDERSGPVERDTWVEFYKYMVKKCIISQNNKDDVDAIRTLDVDEYVMQNVVKNKSDVWINMHEHFVNYKNMKIPSYWTGYIDKEDNKEKNKSHLSLECQSYFYIYVDRNKLEKSEEEISKCLLGEIKNLTTADILGLCK